jgi:hypothetical protein
VVAGAVLDRRRALGGFSLVDRFGAPVAPAMTVVFAAVAVLPAFAGSPVALGVVLLVLGAASGATDVAINAAGVRAEIRSQRPVMNLAHAWFSVCVAVASLSTAAPRAVGAGPRLVLLAASSLVAVITVVALVPGALRLRDQSGNGDILAISELRTPWPGGTTWRPATPLIIFGCLGALAYFVENAWQSWGAVHMETTLKAGAGLSSTASRWPGWARRSVRPRSSASLADGPTREAWSRSPDGDRVRLPGFLGGSGRGGIGVVGNVPIHRPGRGSGRRGVARRTVPAHSTHCPARQH